MFIYLYVSAWDFVSNRIIFIVDAIKEYNIVQCVCENKSSFIILLEFLGLPDKFFIDSESYKIP